MIRLGSVVINCADLDRMTAFWSAALHLDPARRAAAGFVRHHQDPDDDFVVLTDPEGNAFCVCAIS